MSDQSTDPTLQESDETIGGLAVGASHGEVLYRRSNTMNPLQQALGALWAVAVSPATFVGRLPKGLRNVFDSIAVGALAWWALPVGGVLGFAAACASGAFGGHILSQIETELSLHPRLQRSARIVTMAAAALTAAQMRMGVVSSSISAVRSGIESVWSGIASVGATAVTAVGSPVTTGGADTGSAATSAAHAATSIGVSVTSLPTLLIAVGGVTLLAVGYRVATPTLVRRRAAKEVGRAAAAEALYRSREVESVDLPGLEAEVGRLTTSLTTAADAGEIPRPVTDEVKLEAGLLAARASLLRASVTSVQSDMGHVLQEVADRAKELAHAPGNQILERSRSLLQTIQAACVVWPVARDVPVPSHHFVTSTTMALMVTPSKTSVDGQPFEGSVLD